MLFIVPVSLSPSVGIFDNLTPCAPLLVKERGKISKRGALAPLKHPDIIKYGRGES